MNARGRDGGRITRPGVGLAAALLGAALAANAEPPVLEWGVVPTPPGAPARVLAAAPEGPRVALGGSRGVTLLPAHGGAGHFVRLEGVRALAFVGDRVFAAATQGLYEVDVEVGARAIPLPAGSEVLDLAAHQGVLAVATSRGVIQRLEPDAAWETVGLPPGPATRITLVDGPPLEGVVWAGGALWSYAVDTPDSPQRLPLPRLAEARPVLVRVASGGLLMVLSDAIARRGARGEEGWTLLRPALPPGARLRDYAAAFGVHWLASDAGLLWSRALEGPYQRETRGPAHAAITELVAGAGGLLAAGARDTWHAQRAASLALRARPPRGPDVRSVQRVALREQALDAEAFARLRRGLDRRGWLPRVGVSGRYERSRSTGGDYDESFASGARRWLHDRDYDHEREWEAGLTLSWDLGDLVYSSESLDLSRESRARIALRDDVLDEVTQLYFERARVSAMLAGRPAEAAERIDLELRRAELTAGLDGWTGGWFSRALRAASPFPGPAPHHQENP